MKRIVSIIAVLLVLTLALTGCFEKPTKPSGDNIENGEVVISKVKDMSTYFTDKVCLGIASITAENETATANKYCTDYEHITRLNLNNGTEYIDKFLIIPKDNTISYDIYSVKLTDEGNIEPEFEIDLDNKEPMILTCDDYESTMPQYGIKIYSNGGYKDFIPLSFSGYDGSLNIFSHEANVVDLTIYE